MDIPSFPNGSGARKTGDLTAYAMSAESERPRGSTRIQQSWNCWFLTARLHLHRLSREDGHNVAAFSDHLSANCFSTLLSIGADGLEKLSDTRKRKMELSSQQSVTNIRDCEAFN